MKDDPREVDWAERHIKALEAWPQSVRLLERITALENESRLVGIGQLIEQIMDRLKRLESQTQFETSEDNDRIKALEDRVTALEGFPRRITPGLSKFPKDAVLGLQRRISESDIGPSFLDRRDANEADEPEGMVIGRGVKPIEGRCAAHSIRGCRTWPCVGVAPSTEYADGYARGECNTRLTATSDVLREAEKRVREYMTGDFSEATVNGVVKAVWGSEAKSPALTGLPSYVEWKRAKGKCCDECSRKYGGQGS